ncbi:MAG: NAD-dependent epimerase/dehydratase family protein, partial [bacterium]|nr:NAD-dependent epimerase/dehydratase family protein [bacterium]
VYGIRSCSLRLTNTFGPRHQMKHHRQGIINWFVRQLLDGQKVKIFGTGTQIRDTNFIDDVVEAMLLAMASEKTNGEVYNIGGTPLSLIELVEKMIKVNSRGEYEIVSYPQEAQKIEIGDYVANWEKFKKVTGWEPKVSIEEGLVKTFEYYSKNKSNYW